MYSFNNTRKIIFTLLVISFLLLFLTSLPLTSAEAKSGCCSWHGGVAYCDSSVGRYVCNDDTYSPTCGCYYAAPAPVCDKPTVGDSGYPTFSQNGCNQDVTFHWNKGSNDDFYSVSLTKSQGDPGPNSDTSSTSFIFKNTAPGKWFFNLKPGRSCGWGDIVYWDVDVPNAQPNLNFNEEIVSEDKRLLHYNVSCATQASITPNIGAIKVGSGFIEIKPTKDQEYVLSAYNGDQKRTNHLTVHYPLVKAAVTESTSDSTANPKDASASADANSSDEGGLLGAGLLASSAAIIYYRWKKSK